MNNIDEQSLIAFGIHIQSVLETMTPDDPEVIELTRRFEKWRLRLLTVRNDVTVRNEVNFDTCDKQE